MRSKKIIKHLEKLSKHLHYYNIMAPFPVYDTEYVEDVDKAIKKMREDKTKDYDSEGVVACRHCKSLHIVTDDIDNNICMRCGSVNELQEFKDIYQYNEFVTKREDE